LPFLSVYGKAGVSSWSVSATASGPFPTFRYNDQGSQFTYGAGVQVQARGIGARLEYEHFNIAATDGANVVTLGILFSFL
jgi:hypothetical protein